MNSRNYKDIIYLSHYEPKYHSCMSKNNRVAQFTSFKALPTFDEQRKVTKIINEEVNPANISKK